VSRESLESAATAAELAGDFAAAAAARRELVRLDPRSPLVRLALARTLDRADAWREAAQTYLEALQRGANAGEIHRHLGTLHLRQGKPALALQHLKKALAAMPEDPESLFRAGMTMHRLRRFRDAVEFLQRAARQLPEAPEVQFNLGLARFETGDHRGALEALAECRALKRGKPWREDPLAPLQLEPSPEFSAEDMSVNDVKLRHDLEQIEYLLGLGRLPPVWDKVAEQYRSLLQETRGVTGGDLVTRFNVHRYPLVARTYKRPFHVAGGRSGGPALNTGIDAKAIEGAYLRATPNLVVVDDLLTAEALADLRRFCRESTIWNNIQRGYLGGYLYDGFACERILDVARELRERLPRVIRGLPLQMIWGYKYDHELQGIGIHADAAAVNVNFWITEDDANLEPEGGGLLVYRKSAPLDWDFDAFNRDPARILRHLGADAADPIRVPHKANRAVIFDSDLFHATDALRFRQGYLNRRINITLLYGLRS